MDQSKTFGERFLECTRTLAIAQVLDAEDFQEPADALELFDPVDVPKRILRMTRGHARDVCETLIEAEVREAGQKILKHRAVLRRVFRSLTEEQETLIAVMHAAAKFESCAAGMMLWPDWYAYFLMGIEL